MRVFKLFIITVVVIMVIGGGFLAYTGFMTEVEIDNHRASVAAIGSAHPSPAYDAARFELLPEPVKRYFDFVFREPPQPIRLVSMQMEGDFRRPQRDGFSRTTAQQTVAAGVPAFIFSATTPMYPCLWVRVYDAFADFKMEMKAKIMSTYTVMNETESPALNKTSLRRWLIEGTLIPMALLPGGPVKWEHVDERRARAIVSMNGVEASLIATFMPDGRLVTLAAEEDGDLNQPYHGSGEHVRRDDYRPIAGMMIPHSFTISRVSKGKIMPFWNGRITAIDIDSTLKEGD